MPPKNKASGVSSSSFFDLRAEIAKHEEEFAKNKVAGKGKVVIGGVKRPDKKPTIWAKPNKGVANRAARDIELEEISKPTLDTARAILERKAKVYDKLRKGKSGGLTDKQFDTLLVDFDSKALDDDHYSSDSEDVDESLSVPGPPKDEDDPVVEYEDEFGRLRTARRSEIPRHLLPSKKTEQEDDFDPLVIHNPVNHFPIYQPSEERIAEIQAEYAEENNPLNMHYDASHEVRAKGAGFYQFSGDAETRRKQMEELRKAREETEKTREDMGAVNLRPGDIEGMVAPQEEKKSRAMEKRKRELEERRALLEAKRRKKNPAEAQPTNSNLQEETSSISPHVDANLSLPRLPDPFAALEAQLQKPSSNKKGKQKAIALPPPENSADAFLAALERDILVKK
ncbi:Coiled-coil domain-containing protein 174-like protein [Abortiporus biennis]